MEKLELKNLAPYLPYGLKIQIGNLKDGYDLEMTCEDEMESQCISVKDVIKGEHKPILRPLSDLTKEIEVNGEKFVPLEIINLHSCKLFHTTRLVNKNGYDFDITQIPHNSFVRLLEWHFDVYGLIEKGLAVDINTLNK